MAWCRWALVPQVAPMAQVAQTKIWCYGPETDGANLVVDATVGVQYLIEIKALGAEAAVPAAEDSPGTVAIHCC